jgi:hypothetical protein
MRSSRPWHLLAGLAAALAAGCATLEAPLDEHLASGAAPVRDCAQWYARLDAEVDAAGVRDAEEARVAGFPYLRVNRTFAALRDRAAQSPAAGEAFVDRLAALDLEARRFEIANLPRARLAGLPGMERQTRQAAWTRTRDCSRLLREIDFSHPERRALVLERATVPDDYSLAMRTLGLYPITRLAFARGVRGWQEETLQAFRRPREAGAAPKTAAQRVRYAPPGDVTLDYATVAAELASAARDPLGLPALSERELDALVTAYAPSFEIEIGGDYDRFGALGWSDDGAPPEVDATELAVYVQTSYTRYAGRMLLQLVYTIWFPERPPEREGDVLAGRLDGLVWRVTLAPDGEPLVYDTIHPCGCYHVFFPTPRAHVKPAPDSIEEWAFVPLELPRVRAGERPRVTLASRTHYVTGVTLVRGADSVARYSFRSYDALRSLERGGDESRSAFGPDGLIKGTERAERFYFWPMGIASAGEMRQWGHHATAFVGRRHFDDADLFERRFVFDLGDAAQGGGR